MSSNIIHVTYDSLGKVLTILFYGGTKYEYYNVDNDTYTDLAQSKSQGDFFDKHIKGKFKFERIY